MSSSLTVVIHVFSLPAGEKFARIHHPASHGRLKFLQPVVCPTQHDTGSFYDTFG